MQSCQKMTSWWRWYWSHLEIHRLLKGREMNSRWWISMFYEQVRRSTRNLEEYELEDNGPVERACEPTCPGRRWSRPGRRRSQICESVAVLAVHIWMKFGTAVYSTSSAASESPTIWSKVQTFCTGSLVAGPSAQSSYKIKLIFLSKSHLRKTRQFKYHALAEAFLLNIFIFGHVINS